MYFKHFQSHNFSRFVTLLPNFLNSAKILKFYFFQELGFVDSDMISYLMVSFSLFVVSPFFLNNIEYQERLEAKFNDIMINHNIKDVSEIVHKALLR